jgi:predicted O-methyltransferase YrrM
VTTSKSPLSDFIDDYTEEPAGSATARARAVDYGITPITSAAAATLTFTAKTIAAKNVVEVGTGTGISALALLDGMVPEGVLTSIDPANELQLAAREVLTAQSIPTRKFRLIAGQPLSVLPKLTDGGYDLVFVNGDALEYVEYVAQAIRLLRPGGVLILHHALWGGLVADERNDEDEPLVIREALAAVKESERFTTALLPVGDGLLLALLD